MRSLSWTCCSRLSARPGVSQALKWLDAELAYIRSEEINLDVFLIHLADAWPAPWSRARIFFDPAILRPTSMTADRVRLWYVDPPVVIVMIAGWVP